jgi:hypothetical protein
MSPHSFALILVFGSALLAFWLAARFPGLAPSTLGYAILHALAGFAAVRAIPDLVSAFTGLGGRAGPFIVSFGIFLPLMTYAFLTGLWVMRFIQRSLSGGLP